MIRSKELILCMVFGFALVCAANLFCFFPHILLVEADDGVFRLYNLAVGFSVVAGSLLCAGFSLSRIKRPEKGMLALGYFCFVVGLTAAYFVGRGENEFLVVATGIACGLGTGLLMVCWFSFLALISERYAMFIQGLQALLGSLIFMGVSRAFPQHGFIVAILCLVLSAGLGIVIYRQTTNLKSETLSISSLKSSFSLFRQQGSLGRSFSVSLLAFVVISLLYGGITAIVMSSANLPKTGNEPAMWGGVMGATIFLAWAWFSKKRDYNLVIKIFFGVFAFVLILPFQGLNICTAMGYQLICLLYFALVIDTFYANRRTLLFMLSVSYALTRGLYIFGLYIPGYFGVRSYIDFTNSVSLLIFLVYVVFMVLLFVFSRDKKTADEVAGGSDIGTAFTGDTPSRKAKYPVADKLFQETSSGGDLLRAAEILGARQGLTKRETEILGYLARGRDAAFICDELVLSRNTVKSYFKTIYAKLDVHSRQEIIDIVEAEANRLS